MPATDQDIAAIKELLAGIGPVAHRKMFGGAGFYAGGGIFAAIVGGQLYLRADETLGAELEAAGAVRWRYPNRKTGKPVAMPYWTMPDDALDDPEIAASWAAKAIAAAGGQGR